MMEEKLHRAASSLPEPQLDYLTVEETFKKRQTQAPVYQKQRRRIALALCFTLLLAGCMFGPTVPEYHLYNGSLSLLFPGIAFDEICELAGWDPELNSAEKFAENSGWTIPNTLGESPKIGANKYNLTTQESHYLLAMLFHHYTYHSISFGYEMENEITREDGTPSTAHWTDADVQLTFGSMDNEVWHRQFGFDENDVWVGHTTVLDYCDTYDLKYQGITLYVGICQFDNDFYGLISQYGQYISWVDYDHNTVFRIYCRDDTPDFAIACAKELIDQMQ